LIIHALSSVWPWLTLFFLPGWFLPIICTRKLFIIHVSVSTPLPLANSSKPP
jgi:hypothetical protein